MTKVTSKANQDRAMSRSDVVDYLKLLLSRHKSLNSYFASFHKEWGNIKDFLNKGHNLMPIGLELLILRMFGKLEVLKKQAYFIHYGVKSMRFHKLDKDALYVPDVYMKHIMNDTKYYSSISIEFIASQFREELIKSEYIEIKFENVRTEVHNLFRVINELMIDMLTDFKRVPALKNAFSDGRS